MNFLCRMLIRCSLLTRFLMLFQANTHACPRIFKKHREEVSSKLYLSNPVFCTDSAWQHELKDDNEAQYIEEIPRSSKSWWAWRVRVRWAQSLAALPHGPGQNWCLMWGNVPTSPVSPSALVLPSCSVLVSGMWLTGSRLSKPGEDSWDISKSVCSLFG